MIIGLIANLTTIIVNLVLILAFYGIYKVIQQPEIITSVIASIAGTGSENISSSTM